MYIIFISVEVQAALVEYYCFTFYLYKCCPTEKLDNNSVN